MDTGPICRMVCLFKAKKLNNIYIEPIASLDTEALGGVQRALYKEMCL